MRYTFSLSHGFGFGVWRNQFTHTVIWSVHVACMSLYLSFDRKNEIPNPATGIWLSILAVILSLISAIFAAGWP